MALNYVTITGTFDDGSGAALSGTATFTPSETVYAAGIPVVSVSNPVQAQIINGLLKNNSGGALTLLATDNSGLTFEGLTGFFYWTVSVTLGQVTQPGWAFFLPHSPSTVDLYTLANTAAGGGGFTSPMTTLGDIITEDSTPTAVRLAGNTSATKKFLTQTGTGSVSALPAWGTIVAGDLPAGTTGAQGALQLDGTAADIKSIGTQAAGAIGKAADSGHVHPYEPWQFYVGAYGAAGNCNIVTDGAMSSSVSPTHLACATSTPFVSGDVGKSITVAGAGAAGADLTTTIATFTDSGHVILTASASTTVSGASVTYGTDDVSAINSALSAAYTYAVANHGYAEILFDPVTYLCAGATSTGTLGTSGQCKAQIPLPVTATTAQKLTFVFRGTRDQSSLYHWQQTTPQRAGAVLATTLNANSQFLSIGTEPSVIGGPLPTNGYGAGTSVFSNCIIIIDGISILTPNNPLICGFDFRGMAQANVISASVLANSGGAVPSSFTAPTQGQQFGCYMPQVNNNDNSNITWYSAEGQNYGLVASEHTTIDSMRAIYCIGGLVCTGGDASGTAHGIFIKYASLEACQLGLQLNYDSASPVKIRALMLDFEAGSGSFSDGNFIYDPNNRGVGEIGVMNITAATPRTATFVGGGVMSGGSGLRVRALDLALGHITPPSVPSTTTALTNGSGADALVCITSGGAAVSAIAVDGTATGLTLSTSGSVSVVVPGGKTITLTYASTAPTWTWYLF